jgi:hypothetical protein
MPAAFAFTRPGHCLPKLLSKNRRSLCDTRRFEQTNPALGTWFCQVLIAPLCLPCYKLDNREEADGVGLKFGTLRPPLGPEALSPPP